METDRDDGGFACPALKGLPDRVTVPVNVLFVGINPGVRSATIGHHFAGYSNRFWKLLYESGLVPEPLTAEDDVRLPGWGLGVTNVIPRMTPGIDTLRPEEYVAGVKVLRRKVRRWRPRIVALVGVTLYRVIFACRAGTVVKLGMQAEEFEGARLFVLPNPSGRNANYSYEEMLEAFTSLKRSAGLQARRRKRT
jgi:TDG/mug DNA glycosylase family protein